MAKITLSHGAGGRRTKKLLDEVILPKIINPSLEEMSDSGKFTINGAELAFTTDSFVVNPIKFPGGDIGKLAVFGTVNDLAVSGAEPICISLSFILEEGLDIGELEDIVRSISEACARCGIFVATGDTKVVERGKGDKIFINTSGVGIVKKKVSPYLVREGDVVFINGGVGEHEASIIASRKELGIDSDIESDCAPVFDEVFKLIDAGLDVHAMRDPTRGGVATALNEIALSCNLGIEVFEEYIPIKPEVKAICEILGFDPLYLACEGRFLAFMPERDGEKAVELLGKGAVIGRVVKTHPGKVVLKNQLGGERVLDMLSGEQLPRIC